MMFNLLVLLVIAMVWVAGLWLAFSPDFSTWADTGIIAAHILPPLFVWISWYFLRRHIQRKRAAEARQREEAAAQERKAARETALQKYEEAMRYRRFGCDCRIVAFSRLGLFAPLAIAEVAEPNIDIRPVSLNRHDDESLEPLLDRLAPAIADALSMIYASCRASAAFPVYVLPPAEIPGEEVLGCLRTIQAELAGEHAPGLNPRGVYPPILFLPASDCVSNSIVSLFETTPDLPGAVVLTFDSPFSRMPHDEFEDEQTPAQRAHEQFAGKPSEAVVALLMTNTELPSMLAAIAEATPASQQNSMTPFWEKAMQTGGQLETLARADTAMRKELSGMPVLGRVHRAVVRECGGARSGVLDMTRRLQDALEHAQINAGLIDLPFAWEGERDAPPSAAKAEQAGVRCGAIVHNAGSVDVAGKRLAALGSALYYFDVDLSPVDNEAAVNIVTGIGDTGRGAGIGQLALCFVYASVHAAPALCAEFLDGEKVATSFVMPAFLAQGDTSNNKRIVNSGVHDGPESA